LYRCGMTTNSGTMKQRACGLSHSASAKKRQRFKGTFRTCGTVAVQRDTSARLTCHATARTIPTVAANSATGSGSSKSRRTQRRTERRRFFASEVPAACPADFWRMVCGEPQGSPVSVSGPASPHTVRHPFAVAGGDSTQRELSMEIRYASCGTGIPSGRLVRAARVVPSSIRSTP
jgi:hypothetical protein